MFNVIRRMGLACTLLALAAGTSSAKQNETKQKQPARAQTPGAKLYRQNCAVCHGNDGKGNGPPPENSPFTEPPPDLTTLAQRHDGQFPDAYVKGVLQNGAKMADHGPAEMPIWGTIFKATSQADEKLVALRINNLIEYLKSIQAK